jgi:uncharacterized repeat protein (TIGR01451 family)
MANENWQPSGCSRRAVLKRGAIGAAVAWAAPAVTTIGSRAVAGTPPPEPEPDGRTSLVVDKSAPPAVFGGQEFEFSIRVTNTGAEVAVNVVIVDDLPDAGEFVSSAPSASPDGGILRLSLGDIAVGATVAATVRWRAPDGEGALTNSVVASADNADAAADAVGVQYGSRTSITGAGVVAAGTGLRNRDNGDITISGIPAGATVNRAVLVWAILYSGPVPPNTIVFNGTTVAADLTATTSGHLCWGDGATIGYAADVTALVGGNGVYAVTNPPNGVVREDADAVGGFPYTDGASLFVFYTAAGVDNQVLTDFSYSTDTAGPITRSFSGIHSVGGPATLYLAGPDGQADFHEGFTFTGAGSITAESTWNGSDPQEGPDFVGAGGGNLWDTDAYDVSSVLPPGQATFTFSHDITGDCIGINAAVLVVSQVAP